MKRFVPLQVDYELPEELEHEINGFLENLNEDDGSLEDCYTAEIKCTLNWCQRDHLLSMEQIEELRNYYLYKGIYHHGQDH